MEVYQLPEFLNKDGKSDVYVHHYVSQHSYLKNKVVLNMNLICILLNGTKEVFGPRLSTRIDNTQMMMISAGNVLMWESIAAGNKLESILIFFSDDFFELICAKHKVRLSESPSQPLTVSMIKDSYIRAFEESVKVLSRDQLSAIQAIKVEELLVYLALRDGNIAFSFPGISDSGKKSGAKFKDVVTANITRGLTVDELAFLCNMSVSTFKRHFQKTFHCSPKKYFIKRRIEQAKRLLLDEKRPSEFYADLHYQNLSSFSNEFKKHVGLSPREFVNLRIG